MGQYLIRLDDVFVYTNDKFNELGINRTTAEGNVMSEELYNIDGMRLNAPAKGVNIVRSVMNDGSVKIQKVIVK